MGFSRQEHWSGLYVLLQEFFPTQGLTQVSGISLHLQGDSLPLAPAGKAKVLTYEANGKTNNRSYLLKYEIKISAVSLQRAQIRRHLPVSLGPSPSVQ